MSKPVSIIVAGCAGRMGRAVLQEIRRHPGSAVRLTGGIDRADCPERGRDLMRLIGVDDMGLAVQPPAEVDLSGTDVVIDFTSPEGALENSKRCADDGVAVVIGATGFSTVHDTEIAALAEKIPIVKSGNMSLGVNALCALVEKAVTLLGDAYDVEISEAHHRRKLDAPSGTALMLGEAAAGALGSSLESRSVYDRTSQRAARAPGEIGFSVIRGGGVIGEHTVRLLADDEEIILSHKAIDRALFARGAVEAARWVAGRSPGLYSMRDVLGI